MQDHNDLIQSMWVFSGGAIIVLLQSILSGMKRNWLSLLSGCAIGGGGSWVAGQIWGNSHYVYLICGAAAVMTENLLLGAMKASKEFADDPITIAKNFIPLLNNNAPTVNVNEAPPEEKK